MASRAGKYRIQAVSEMTGIPAATLRAWERRYGIPAPGRTAASYRLYSDHDVALIRELQALCASGMSPADAARQLTEANAANDPIPSPERIDPFQRGRDAIVQAVAQFDPDAVEAAVQRALHLGSASTVFDRVLGPALAVVGERWYTGELSTGQEHMASEIIGNALRGTLRLVQPTGVTRKALLACFADETHELPLIGIGLRLCAWGFRTILLGARTPPSALRHAVSELQPDIVGLSLTIAPAPHEIRRLVEEYANACNSTPWIVGGRAAGTLRFHVEHHGGLMLTNEPPTDTPTKMKAALERYIGDYPRTRGPSAPTSTRAKASKAASKRRGRRRKSSAGKTQEPVKPVTSIPDETDNALAPPDTNQKLACSDAG